MAFATRGIAASDSKRGLAAKGERVMPVRVITSPGGQSLEDFQKFVQHQESAVGPLKDLGRQGGENRVTLEVGRRPTLGLVTLEICFLGDRLEKSGYELVCFGECVIAGRPVCVAAYRRLADPFESVMAEAE